MSEVIAYYLGNSYAETNTNRRHIMTSAELDRGGSRHAPSPLELYITALTTSVMHDAAAFCEAHKLPTNEMEVVMHYEMETYPPCLRYLNAEIRLPFANCASVEDELKRAAILSVNHLIHPEVDGLWVDVYDQRHHREIIKAPPKALASV